MKQVWIRVHVSVDQLRAPTVRLSADLQQTTNAPFSHVMHSFLLLYSPHFGSFIIIFISWHISPCHQARGNAPAWQCGAARNTEFQKCVKDFITARKIENSALWFYSTGAELSKTWITWGILLSSLNAQGCMCIRWACMQERRHADRVFTSPTLSRLSSFSSREVVYKGS